MVKKAGKAGAKAIIIGCFDDTGLMAARELAICPVLDIGQPAYRVALLYGGQFSVVTTLAVSFPILAKNIRAYGPNTNLVRVRASGVPVHALEDDRDTAMRQVVDGIRPALREDDIDCVVLGCAGRVHFVDDADDVPTKLVDGVHAAAHLASLF
ncbi:aspartate/glutamate racemase family protein [Pseudooctadecabacter sp.]|uniref:aspartate/glutamate racemase family protein n=1 Tax=Pseudooctadecabacter sp. TaxID=1966338 RepID=UPI0035C7DF46